jgi:hypothetical protein
VPEVEVSNVQTRDEGISFDVDRVGTPVLVKISYFPNWKVSGADGPYRVAPNLMVVVPTDKHVSLTYGRTGVEYLSYTLTLLGIIGLVLLIRRPVMRFTGPEARADAAAVAAVPAPGNGHRPGVAEDDPSWMRGPWGPRTWPPPDASVGPPGATPPAPPRPAPPGVEPSSAAAGRPDPPDADADKPGTGPPDADAPAAESPEVAPPGDWVPPEET